MCVYVIILIPSIFFNAPMLCLICGYQYAIEVTQRVKIEEGREKFEKEKKKNEWFYISGMRRL